jgi:hypothetical protein
MRWICALGSVLAVIVATTGTTMAADCDPFPIGRLCQCEDANGNYKLQYSGYREGDAVTCTVVIGDEDSTTVLSETSGTADDGNHVVSDANGIAGSLQVTLLISDGPNGCGPHTMANENWRIDMLDECCD